jgi:oligopeptide/dipeptide ABC transporter ATP-binding protein
MEGLELRDIVVEYERREQSRLIAVAGASLAVRRGQIVGLVGETGCGKSSLARAAVGLVSLRRGEVLLDGAPLSAMTQYRARAQRDRAVQMVFQNPFGSLNPRRRVGEQIADGFDPRGDFRTRAKQRARVVELLREVGMLAEDADRFPQQYSGGQRQRIAIARALAASPSILVLDEPLSSLDASVQAQVANLLRRLTTELNVGMLLISHDLAIVRHIADVVAVMYLGEIVETGPTARLWSQPAHPYTQALIRAIPRVNAVGVLPETLPGEVPDASRPPPGCRFNPRCPYVFDKCLVVHPTLMPRGEQHAACWLVERDASATLMEVAAGRPR